MGIILPEEIAVGLQWDGVCRTLTLMFDKIRLWDQRMIPGKVSLEKGLEH